MSEIRTEIITGVLDKAASLVETGEVNIVNTYFSEGTWKFIGTRVTEIKGDKPVVFEVKGGKNP